jgi:hypothetical protein
MHLYAGGIKEGAGVTVLARDVVPAAPRPLPPPFSRCCPGVAGCPRPQEGAGEMYAADGVGAYHVQCTRAEVTSRLVEGARSFRGRPLTLREVMPLPWYRGIKRHPLGYHQPRSGPPQACGG